MSSRHAVRCWRFLLQQYRMKGTPLPPAPRGVYYCCFWQQFVFQTCWAMKSGSFETLPNRPKITPWLLWLRKALKQHMAQLFLSTEVWSALLLTIQFLDAKGGIWHRVRYTWANKHFSLKTRWAASSSLVRLVLEKVWLQSCTWAQLGRVGVSTGQKACQG